MGQLTRDLFMLAALDTTAVLCILAILHYPVRLIDVVVMFWIWPLAFGKLALEISGK